MSTIANPAVSAPAASAPVTPAPAAAPAPSPAPVATPEATPVETPAVEQTLEQRLEASWTKVNETPAEAAAAEQTPETKPAESETKPAEAETKPAEGETKPAEGETKPAETKPEEGEEISLDALDTLDPRDFFSGIGKNPEVKKYFDENPKVRDQIAAALRRDNETRGIRAMIPNVETAERAVQGAAQWESFDQSFMNATTKEGAQDFMRSIAALSIVRDAEGNPVKGENGQYQFHPAMANTFQHIVDNRVSIAAQQAETTGQMPADFAPIVDALYKHAQQSGNDRLEAALEVLREAAGSPSSPGLENLPDELKPLAESLQRKEAELSEQEQAAARKQQGEREAANTESIDRAESAAAEVVNGQLNKLFSKAGLTEFEAKAAREQIGDLIDQKLEANPLYKSIYKAIVAAPPSEAREKQLNKHILSFMQEIWPTVAADIIRQAKGGALERQQATEQKVEAQQEVTRKTEPKGATVTPNSSSKQTVSMAQIRKEYADAHNGDPMPLEEAIREHAKRNGAFGNQQGQ